MAYETQINIFGNPSGDVVTYSISKVSAGQAIDDAKFVQVAAAVNSERVRRGSGTQSYTFSDAINDEELNALVQGLHTAAVPYTAGFQGVIGTFDGSPQDGVVGGSPPVGIIPPSATPGDTIGDGSFGAADEGINAMIDKVVAAGQVCLCNCNYCTCNCNFCTCNCNHACTCNCNYSDERLKTDIEYL